MFILGDGWRRRRMDEDGYGLGEQQKMVPLYIVLGG
jgi:hypothetical protein